MKTARITNQQASEALFPLVDDSISTVAREEEMAAETAAVDALIDEAVGDRIPEIEALIEAAEREWIAAGLEESFRVSRDLTDQVRARRAHRRVGREVLRALPSRLDLGEAA